jgi:hypothetical protein
MPNPTVDILATRGARMRWFKILDRRQLGRIDVNGITTVPVLSCPPDYKRLYSPAINPFVTSFSLCVSCP